MPFSMPYSATPHRVMCRRPINPTHSVPAAIHCLSRLLRERSVRILFQRVSGSVQLLAPLLRSNASSAAPNQQLLYEAGMCVWQLTFYEPAAEAMGSSGVVQGLVDMARSATKEKVMPNPRSAVHHVSCKIRNAYYEWQDGLAMSSAFICLSLPGESRSRLTLLVPSWKSISVTSIGSTSIASQASMVRSSSCKPADASGC